VRRHASTCCALAIGLTAIFGGGSAAAAGCSNEAVRAQQGAAHLPECRAFEQVSPVEKGVSEIDIRSPHVQAAPQGGAVSFGSLNSLPGAASSPIQSAYVARRGATDWSTTQIDPPETNGALQLLRPTRWISESLDRAVDASLFPLAPGALEGHDHVYVHDLRSGERELAVQLPSLALVGLLDQFVDPFDGPIWSASSDLSHFVFQFTGPPLVDDAPEGADVAYEWADGELRLVGRDIDGSPFPVSVSMGAARIGSRSISDDGSRIYFSASSPIPGGPLYLRENGTSTTLVSGSQQTGKDPTNPINVEFLSTTADGRYAFFQSGRAMTDEPIAEPVGATLLYRFDAETGDIELLVDTSVGLPLATGLFVWRVSSGGERIYFESTVHLTPDAGPTGNPSLYVWQESGVQYIGPSAPPGSPLQIQASPDGRFVAIKTVSPLDGAVNPPNPDCPKGKPPFDDNPEGVCYEVYAYDAQTDALTCASCLSSGDSRGNAGLGMYPIRGNSFDPRAALADGTVYFDTPNRLVPEDVNGVRDVYEWRAGTVRLLSSGTDTSPASFVEANADGTDVFTMTRGRLVAQDSDNAMDVYDIRRDGGLAVQNQLTNSRLGCEGDACQGSPGAPPAAPTAGSQGLLGPPSPSAGRKVRCKPAQARKGKRGKASKSAAKCRAAKKQGKAEKQGKGARRTAR
jgi:hypothetical protein